MMDMTVGVHVAHNARRFPNKTALIEGTRKLSYRQLDLASNRIANALAANGIGRGDKVALLCKSSLEWISSFIATAKLGAATVPLNYRLTSHEIGDNLADSESKILFASEEYYARAKQDIKAGRVVIVDGKGQGSLQEFLNGHDEAPPNCSVSASDIQLIMYTGGTTGRSKGVLLSHENVFWNSLHEIIDTDMHEDDNTILATPLHHAAALNCWLLPHLYLGATATLLHDYSPERMLKTIAEHRVTNGFTPPSMARDLIVCPIVKELDLSSFARWYVGGASLSRKDREAMHALIPGVRIYYQYGLSEAGVIVTVLKEKDYERAPNSIGRAFLDFETKILREDLTDADFGEVGEIAVRGPSVMKGYYNKPEATAAVFHKGWLRTGDMGATDKEGFITFHDRLKDMVKTGGLNVYSQEVEQALLQHPAVREAAIVGMPSDRWGEEVTGIIVLHDDRSVSEEDIIAFGKGCLAHYKVPKRIVFFEYHELPINFSGKIMKRELRQKLAAV